MHRVQGAPLILNTAKLYLKKRFPTGHNYGHLLDRKPARRVKFKAFRRTYPAAIGVIFDRYEGLLTADVGGQGEAAGRAERGGRRVGA